MLKVKVGDIVEMKHGIPPQRIIGVAPMNNLTPDRVDVTDADAPETSRGVGVPLSWVKKIIKTK